MAEIAGGCVVRMAGPDDLVAVLTVHRIAGNAPGDATSELMIDTWRRMQSTADLSVYLAEIDGRPVGTASLLLMPNVTYGCAPTAFIEAVVVIPEYRRQGIATVLLRRILADAQAAGCNKVQLLSHKRHAADGAHGLYRGLGFDAEAEGFRLYLGEVPLAVRTARTK